MAEGSTIENIDAAIAQFVGSWNLYTIALVVILLTVLLYPLFTGRDPDIHPYMLARQSQAAPVRQPEESAVLHAVDVPHGYPLRAGLGIKDPGAPRWSVGRNGDLRDIWRQAVRGPVKEDGTPDGTKAKIVTLLGREKVVEHSFEDLTRDINSIGGYVKNKGAKSAAVCLPNSVELLCSIFAAAFNGISVTLLPYGLPASQVASYLADCNADVLITEAGTVEVDSLSSTTSIRNFIWVVKGDSKHMDWSGSVNSEAWHEIVQKYASSESSQVVPVDKDTKVEAITTFATTQYGYEKVDFTSENIISAVSALTATLTRTHKMTSADTFIATTSLTESYTLCWTLAALFSNASVAFNSMAGDAVDLALATAGISPTIIATSPGTIGRYHSQITTSSPGFIGKMSQNFQRQTLQAGNMPLKRPLVAVSSLRKLRVLLIGQSTAQGPKITSSVLSNLRLLLGTRIGYALTTPKVAGAVCQTNVLDYRDKGNVVNVGPPLSSVEIHITGSEAEMSSPSPQGKLVVKGPPVTGGKVTLSAIAKIDDDYTISLV